MAKPRTVAVTMVKNESDLIAGTIRHMATQVDHVIVADNRSGDGTREILDGLALDLPLTVLDDPDPAYHQGPKMTRLAALAGALGAQWIVPFDADELYSTTCGAPLADVLGGIPESIVHTSPYTHHPTGADQPTGDPFTTMVWRSTTPDPIDKIVFRWEAGATIRQGNHSVALPSGGPTRRGTPPPLVLRHFPNRSADQFVSKIAQGSAAYNLTRLPLSEGAHWRRLGALLDRGGRRALERHYSQHIHRDNPLATGLVRDPAPYLGGDR